MMTRKDYVRTAEILNAFKDEIDQTIFEDLIFNFGEMFASDNQRFDHSRFAKASKGEK
jgi:hypothetical protein